MTRALLVALAIFLASSCANGPREAPSGNGAGNGAGSETDNGAAAAATGQPFEVEYRQITKHPTCLGNRRIKLDAGGNIFSAVNATECAEDQRWSTPYPAAPVRTLGHAERQDLLALIRGSGFLDLAPRHVNPDYEDGFIEEIDVTLAGKTHSVVMDNTDDPRFAKVRQALVRAAR